MNPKSDCELLSDFAERQNEWAFGELVRRHLSLVHSAALRLAPSQAEDVSQAVFVALAQQAGAVAVRLKKGAPLSGWLHLTTRNLAAKAVRTEMRRRTRERAVPAMATPAEPPQEDWWPRMAPHLDHALAELAEMDRDAILMRFFESKTAREIGERLGLSEEAAQKRIVRALERLRERFVLRGVVVPAAAMTALLGAQAVQSAPAALAGGIAAAAVTAAVETAPAASLVAWAAKQTATLIMTKSQLAILTGTAVLSAIPLAIQYRDINQARADLAELRAASVPPPLPAPGGDSQGSEAEEMERLRRDIRDLEDGLATRREAPTLVRRQEAAGTTLLVPGRTVPLSELVVAGSSTPEAALQSYLALQRDGNLEGVLGLMLDQPTEEEQQRWLMLEEGRARMAAALKKEVEPIQSVALLAQKPISAFRTQLVIQESRVDGPVTNTVSLGRTSQGWKITL